MNKHVVIITIMLFALFSGGCAVVPALVTTGASFAVPQTVSVAMTAAGTVHKTALVAADERNMDEIISDKMLTIQAQAVLLDETGVAAEATVLNGDVYLVGEYVSPSDRDEAIEELQDIKGINSVKGVLKPMPTSLVALVKPTISDNHAETVIESGLVAELHIKSANVDVEVVQGEAVITGVVWDKEEADSVVDIVKGLRPDSETPIKVTSLLAFQEVFEAGAVQENQQYALMTQSQMLAAATPAAEPRPIVAKEQPVQVATTPAPSIHDLSAKYAHLERSTWQSARVAMKRRILALSKVEADPRAKKELITLSTKVLKDKYTSIEDRLVRTLHNTSSITVKRHINGILADIAPNRSKRIHTLAMN